MKLLVILILIMTVMFPIKAAATGDGISPSGVSSQETNVVSDAISDTTNPAPMVVYIFVIIYAFIAALPGLAILALLIVIAILIKKKC